MAQSKHVLKKNLKEYVNERERWCAAVQDCSAPYMVQHAALTHIRELDRRIQNIHWQLDETHDMPRL